MIKEEKDKTPNLQVNKKRLPQIEAILTYTSNSNQETVPLFRPQQEASVFRHISPDASVVAIKSSQDISSQIFSPILYTLIMIKSRWPES